MKPAGVIVTYITRQDWKGKKLLKKIGIIFFNLCLFVFQFIFMVVGTAIGKIKWDCEAVLITKVLSILIVGFCITGSISAVSLGYYWSFPIFILALLKAIVDFRGIDWRRVWRAAQASHVRLCLKKAEATLDTWQYINFGYPKVKLDYWHIDQCDGKRFEYREPTFTLPQEAIAEMIDYAEGEVGKEYDDLQLGSPILNFPIWVCNPPLWGREKIGWLNREGGREFCSSGVTACLRWAAKYIHPDELLFFFDYDTAMVMPCLIVISEKWRVK